MAIYEIPWTSAAAVGANVDIGNIPGGTSSGYILRRLVGSIRCDSGSPSNQQAMLALYKVTARGTQSSTTAPEPTDPNWMAATAPVPGVDLTWSVAFTKGNLFKVVAVNCTGGGFDLPFEGLQGKVVPIGTANGIGLHNIALALPANHRWNITAFIEC